jgi:hypothetical protein
MKLLKLHITILFLLGLPGLLVPLSLWAPANILPDILGITAILYVMLWIIHTVITSLLMGGLLFFRMGRTHQAVVSTHVIIFIVMLAYAIFLFSS